MQYYRRNLQVLCLAIFLASISWFQVMPFLPFFLREMGVEGKGSLLRWSGIIFSCQSLASIMAVPYWGKLGDRYGRKPMTMRAGICLAGIYFGMGACHTPLQLAILRFLNGALTGFIPGAIALIATGTPRQHAPQAVATAQTASAVGQILGPGIGGLLMDWFTFRGSMRVSGCAVVVSTLLVWVFVRETRRAEPEEQTSLVDDFRLAFRSPILASIMLVVLINGFFMASVDPVLAIHLKEIASGAPRWLTGPVFSLPAAAFILSARRWSRRGDRVGYDHNIRTGLIGAAICAMCLAAVRSIWLFAIAFFALGLCVAAIAPSTGAVICTRIPEDFRGRAYGMQQSAATVAGLLAPVLATQVAAHLGVPSVFIATGTLYVAGMFAFRRLAARWPKEA